VNAAARFRGVPGSVAEARRFVSGTLRRSHPELDDLATVIVSELATNAVLHGASDYTVTVHQVEGGVRVIVTDQGAGRPTLQRPGPSDLHGRGLQIVNQMSDAWGVLPAGADHGKSVWFEVRVPHRP
jgi:anti-sigma regulatory factor (Ser/Thr protein kinase)